MTGHRKRMYLALPRWSHEIYSTNRSIVAPHYSDRMRKRARKVSRKLLRAFQKRQDRKELHDNHGDDAVPEQG